MEGLLSYLFFAALFFGALSLIGKIFGKIDKHATGNRVWEGTKKAGACTSSGFVKLLTYVFVALIILTIIVKILGLFSSEGGAEYFEDPPRGLP